jgi:hypothetical protein
MKAAYERGAGQPTHPPCRLEILLPLTQVKPWIENNRPIGNETPNAKSGGRHAAT